MVLQVGYVIIQSMQVGGLECGGNNVPMISWVNGWLSLGIRIVGGILALGWCL